MDILKKMIAFIAIISTAAFMYIWLNRAFPELYLSNIGAAFIVGLGMGAGALLGHIFILIDRKK